MTSSAVDRDDLHQDFARRIRTLDLHALSAGCPQHVRKQFQIEPSGQRVERTPLNRVVVQPVVRELDARSQMHRFHGRDRREHVLSVRFHESSSSHHWTTVPGVMPLTPGSVASIGCAPATVSRAHDRRAAHKQNNCEVASESPSRTCRTSVTYAKLGA